MGKPGDEHAGAGGQGDVATMHLSRFLVLLVVTTAIYLAAVASFSTWDVLTAVLVAGFLLVVFRTAHVEPAPAAPEVAPRFLRRLAALFPFLAAAFVEVVRSTWNVFLISTRIRPLRRAGIVSLPMGERSDLGIVVTALVLTVTPGSVLLDLDWEAREIILHVIDASDPDKLRTHYQQFYRRYQQRVFA